MNNDLISMAKAVEIAMKYCPDDDGSCSKADVDIREMLDELENLPVIYAEPMRYGQWVLDNSTKKWDIVTWVCSECGGKVYTGTIREEELQYCPRCGAKMSFKER